MEMARIKTLLIDDDRNIRQTLTVSLKGLGCEVDTAGSVDDALKCLRQGAYDFVLTDFKLEGRTGLEVIQAARQLQPASVVVLMTAFASFENAVNAIKEGAFDYLPKPFSNSQLGHLLQKVRTVIDLKRENERLRQGTAREQFFSGMSSPAMVRLEEFVDKVGPTDATVLITGESGTGKSALAKILHERSARKDRPWVTVHCTTLTENLLESELFGHVRGAFTGAVQDHVGKLELANHGTLFLDEVGELSPSGQAKLLRVLQEKIVERVGGNKSIPVDVRVLAATNRNLGEDVANGRFREDLFYRLNVLECILAPLRHRREDIPILIERFRREFASSAQQQSSLLQPFPAGVLEALRSYSWPGNVRELRNILERLMILSNGRDMTLEDLPPAVRSRSEPGAKSGINPAELGTLEDMERAHIERILKVAASQEEAARLLGITTVTLWRKRKQYGLP